MWFKFKWLKNLSRQRDSEYLKKVFIRTMARFYQITIKWKYRCTITLSGTNQIQHPSPHNDHSTQNSDYSHLFTLINLIPPTHKTHCNTPVLCQASNRNCPLSSVSDSLRYLKNFWTFKYTHLWLTKIWLLDLWPAGNLCQHPFVTWHPAISSVPLNLLATRWTNVKSCKRKDHY